MRLVLISFFALTFNFSQAYSADQSLLNQIDRTIAPSCEINEVPAPNEPTGKLNIKRCELFNSNHLPVLIISQVGDSEAKLYRPGEMTPLVFNDQEYGSLQTAMLRFSADDEDLMKNNMKAYNHSKDCDSLHSNQYNNGLSPIAGDTLFDGLMKVSLQPGGSPL
ncbi:MAG: hypothetical protein KDD50_09590, partial [Bdellovibrionales bacterium]|nr:hypothetical protein [Bdellovibrionales bacterium]